MPSALARLRASKASPAASAPCAPLTTGVPVRSPQTRSCSIAAARKVSPAASITDRPSALRLSESLPSVVVLPAPFTPIIRTMKGFFAGSITRGLATGSNARSTSVARMARTSSGEMPFS